MVWKIVFSLIFAIFCGANSQISIFAEPETDVYLDTSVVEYDEPLEYDEPDEFTTDVSYDEIISLYLDAVEAYNTSMEVYQGTINTTYLTIFRDVVSNIGVTDDYVLFRSSDDTYSMLVGDLEFSNGEFYLSDFGQLYSVTNVSGGYGYNSYYSYDVVDVSSYSVVVGDYLVYSNLGGYPSLIDRGVNYAFVTLLVFCIFSICCLLRPLFKFVSRSR